MELDWSPQETAFRQEVQEFLAAELTDEVQGSMFVNTPARVAFVDKLAQRGWLGMGFPPEYGGSPKPFPLAQFILNTELERVNAPTVGKNVVIVGRSDIVGRPLALMLSQSDSTCGPETANATVTICHSRSQNLGEITRQAEILIAAVGRPEFITADMIRKDAVVIDVGINRTDDGLVGDVEFEGAEKVASAITPVPGGVGPMTVTMLLYNTLKAARLQKDAQPV